MQIRAKEYEECPGIHIELAPYRGLGMSSLRDPRIDLSDFETPECRKEASRSSMATSMHANERLFVAHITDIIP